MAKTKRKSKSLRAQDYKTILAFYHVPLHKKWTTVDLKRIASSLLNQKLCRCIKSIQPKPTRTNERKAIAVCVNSVINKKGLKIRRFTCKRRANLLVELP